MDGDRFAMNIKTEAVAWLDARRRASIPQTKVERPTLPAGVVPKGEELAMDWGGAADPYAYVNMGSLAEFAPYGIPTTFIGYPTLAMLAQIAEFRNPVEIMAEEMTRKWIKIKAASDTEKGERVAAIEKAMTRLKLREAFKTQAEHAGFYGIGQIAMNFGEIEGPTLQQPIVPSSRTIKKGSLKGFVNVEPYWMAPTDYNTANPMHAAFYKPQKWFIMGQQVSSTRLLTFIPRPVSDILKPAYNFGGISLSQLLFASIRDWLRTAQSVSDLLHSFTIPVLKTDMGGLLMGGGSEMVDMRAQAFNLLRDIRGLFTISKGSGDTDPAEELEFVSAPLGGLEALKAQTQERQAALGRIPFVKLFGITPAGLNASSDGEIRAFYDSVSASQEGEYTDNLKRALDFIQLSEFGEIDPDISFDWEALWQLDDLQRAQVRKTEADIDAQNVDKGIIDPEEARQRQAQQADSQYAGIDLSGPAPTPPEPEEDERAPGADQGEPDGQGAA